MALRDRVPTTRRWRLRVVLGALVLLALAVPGASLGTGNIPEIHKKEKANVDKRTGEVAPSAAQRGAVERLGARGRWNRFGTPSSVMKDGGYLAANVPGDDAAAAARAFVRDTKDLFKIDNVDGLQLAKDAELVGSNGHAVSFRQRVDGLPVSPEALLTVGVMGSAQAGWNVGYASSSLVGEEPLAGSPSLSLARAGRRPEDGLSLSAAGRCRAGRGPRPRRSAW